MKLPDQPPGRGPNGKPFCRICAKEVSGRRRTFCSDECTEFYNVRANSSHARHLVWKRDKGICAICGFSCERLENILKHLSDRASFYPFEGYRYSDGRRATLHDRERLRRILTKLRSRGWPCYESSGTWKALWEMDHVVPVSEGGGSCGLDGLRTLCRRCHKEETAKMHKRLRVARKAA